MGARAQLRILMLALCAVGFGMMAYKHLSLGFPLVPGAKETVWTVQARIRFEARGEPAKVRLNLPDNTSSLVITTSGGAAPGFGFNTLDEEGQAETHGVWASRAPEGEQTIYYEARVHRGFGDFEDASEEARPKKPEKPVFEGREAAAADAILAEAFRHSADPETFSVRLVEILARGQEDNNVRTLVLGDGESFDPGRLMLELLHSAEIPARVLRGIDLAEIGRRSTLTNLLEIHDGERWHVIDPRDASVGLPELFLPWQRGGHALYEIEGGSNSEISFAVRADELAARNVALTLGKAQDASVIDFSIFTLPVDVQNTFASLLLIPVGALVVVVVRNLVGFRTSGTFMPILIAISLVQTTLVTGLILFLVVIGFGLAIRAYLTRLNLLLVPRIASVIIVVITIYVAMSIVGYKMGVTSAFSVTFFPMIIISWTIERMSILWEEDGPREVMIQGAGSLATAVLAYVVMTDRTVGFLVFAYPELLLVVLAVILAIGQYTGYRLSELRRFEPLARDLK